ncbi:prepilin-type N-terminal cleavage/methylation domain-containing protein [Thalassomonas viridans]|uniref:Prepilin-type N-terminal cleavage/methylation domain-containing protein n=1 Tax=Thalassomonas viridans TaxID=137584 RepID=A0AAE9Z0F9_9GAMM|nr:prepilin-type N-terminal cleavage/methylation domain-containing protein [Thalassomonas viridans]WDE03952.1 prepilin-type N-terminal cleavage/methylation domain-containing protein [Thalassomonas viridans]
MASKNSGFTLIEVLVASAILFSSIAVVSLIFKSSYLASEKAELRVGQAGLLPALLKLVQAEIRSKSDDDNDKISGQGTIWGQNYQWDANLIAFRAAPDKFDIDIGKMQSYPKKYKLWQVKLRLGNGKGVRDFQYYELSWLHS